MEEKELKELMDGLAAKNGKAIQDAVKTEVEAAAAKLMTSDQLGQKLEAIGLKDDTIKNLVEAVEKQGLELQKALNPKNKEAEKSLDEIIEEKAAEIQSLAKEAVGGRGGKIVSLKVSHDQVNKTLVQRSAVGSSTMAMRLPEVGQLPYLGTVMSGLFRHATVSPSSNGVIRYIDQATVTRAAATRAEGVQKPESAITWAERTCTIEKIADSIPVTREAWNDVGFIRSEIDRLLNVNLALEEDEQLWDGDGNTPNLRGVYTSAPAFDPGSYAGPAIQNASLYDLLAVLRVQIANNRQSKYMPNVAVINPLDMLSMKLAKGSDGHYVLPPFITANGQTVDGMRVVESSQVTANTLAIGDFRFGTIYDLEGISIDMGYVNDQFIKNTMTILAEKRLALLIRTVDETAFLKVTDITAALAGIAQGSGSGS